MTDYTLKEDLAIIQMALDLVKERYPHISIPSEDYSCKIWRGSKGVAVDFTRIIRFVPLGRNENELEYDLIVNLKSKVVLPFEQPILAREFFIPKKSDLKAVDFVKKHFGVFSPHFQNTIIEEAESYKISCTNEASFGYYSINKKTGEEGSVLQGSYILTQKPKLGDTDN